jgi:cytochrome c2
LFIRLTKGEIPMSTIAVKAQRLIAVSLLTLLAAAAVYGQGSSLLIRASVPFAFEAHGTQLPAGVYRFKIYPTSHSLIISGAPGGDVRLPIITQLGGSSVFKDTGLVFDSYEGKHVLSEIWVPGEDGVLVSSTPKQHTHEFVLAMSGGGPNRSGKEIFQSTCERCHGPKGGGNAAADKFFKTSVPKLSSAYVQSKSDAELKDIISNGKGMMDPVRMGQSRVQHLLDQQSVDAVIAYLRTLKQQ